MWPPLGPRGTYFAGNLITVKHRRQVRNLQCRRLAQTARSLFFLGKGSPELSGVPALPVWILGELLVPGISQRPVREPGTFLWARGLLPWEATVQLGGGHREQLWGPGPSVIQIQIKCSDPQHSATLCAPAQLLFPLSPPLSSPSLLVPSPPLPYSPGGT